LLCQVSLLVADDVAQTRRARARVERAVSRDEPAIEEALYRWKDSAADFVDCLIVAHKRRLGCLATVSV
jgi:predicted nucleic acid-binding protein